MPVYLNPVAAPYPTRLSGQRSIRASMRRRRALLGYLSSAETLPLPSQYCGKNCGSQIFLSFLQQAIATRLLPMPTKQTASTDCTGGQVSNAAGKASSVAASAVAAGTTIAATLAPALNVIPIVGTIASVILGGVSAIFTHHAQAVQMQSNVLCENVPAANQLLQQIDQELQQGLASTSQASGAYDAILSQFTAAMKSDPSYKTGDALWGYVQALAAVVAARKADLQAGVMADGTPIPGASAASSLGIPPAVLWGGAALLAIWLLA